MKLILILFVIIFLFNNIIKNKNERFMNYNFNDKYNVFLISNKKDLKPEYIDYINKITPGNKDKIVRFNLSHNPKILFGETDIAVFRNNKYHYHGYNYPLWKSIKNKDIILLGRNKTTNETVFFFKNNNNKVKILDYDKVNGKTESSGKIMINYFLENEKINKIYLIGFDFYNQQINWHNFKNEKKILKKYPNKIKQL